MADINLLSPLRANLTELPTELKRIIILYMDLPTIKSTRLTCKLLCTLSTPYLIPPTFHSFAHRPDFNRLLNVCRHPLFHPCIQSLELNLGEISEYHGRHNIYFSQYMRSPETRAAEAEDAWFRYSNLRFLRDEYTPLICDLNVLSEAFRSLTNLSTLSVSMANFPLPREPVLAILETIWRIPSTRLLRRELAKERFNTILCSLLPSVDNTKLRNLSHDRLPFEFFTQNKTLIRSMTPIFQNLTDLRLVLDYSDTPPVLHSLQSFENLAICLQAAENLQNLNLCFQSRRKIDITPLLENLLSNAQGSNSTFPNLQSLHIEGLASAFYPLAHFLTSLAPTLKSLEFGGEGCHGPNQIANGGIHLLDGKFSELFKGIEEVMKESLTRFIIKGDLVEVEGGGTWFLNREVAWHGLMD